MIRLAARFAISGGRENAIRLVLTAIGVAVGTTLLLTAAAVDPAIRAHQKHEAWQHTGMDADGLQGDNAPLRWHLDRDVVAGQELTVLRVAATGPTSPIPLGLDHAPRPGEVYVSPPLARLIDELPADRLADRFPSPPAGTIDEVFMSGPDHLIAVIGVPEAALPVGHDVHRIRTAPAPYQFTDVLRIVLGIGAIGLLMPVLVFVTTSTRLGAARREQRFAALRLAGATPRQVNLVAGVEAAAASAVGVTLGAIGFGLVRPLVADIEIDGHPSFFTDVQVPPVLFAAILVGVPVLAVAAAMVSLRRLQISPLGVARRSARPRPTARRVVPFVGGSIGFAISLAAAVGSTGVATLLAVMATFALMIYGIVAAGPWLTVLTARTITRFSRRAGALLAGRRLEDDPASGFRAVSGLVLAVFIASVFSGITPALLKQQRNERIGLATANTMVGVHIGGAEPAAWQAALDAVHTAGGGHAALLRLDPDPDGLPTDRTDGGRSVVEVAVCDEVRPFVGSGDCPAGGTAYLAAGASGLELLPSTLTPAEVRNLRPSTMVVETDGSPAVTDRVRTAIQRTVPGAATWLGAEQQQEGNRRMRQLERLANLALAITLVIAGCGLAVAVAAGIIERKRPFALLRLSGVHLGELQRVAFVEAAAPLLLIAGASAVLGLATSAVIVTIAGGASWVPPDPGYWLSLVGGLVLSLGVAAASLPLLGPTTAPSAVRFE
jgi:FtsX-like permease family